MSVQFSNLQNETRKVVDSLGCFQVIEYVRDCSVSPWNATDEYFMAQMGVRRRQVMAQLDGTVGVVAQAGAMQWMAGGVKATTGIKSAGDFLGKLVKGAVTKETAVKPEYVGNGVLMLEPTYKYLILQDVGAWGPDGMAVEDGMFLASENSVKQKIVARKNLSSALFGNEGLFNLCLRGSGAVVLESNVPAEELIEVQLQEDVLKIDGRLAVCWSAGLDFTVERVTRTLAGSAVSGEGLVNVYRGTGRVLLSPVAPSDSLFDATNSMGAKAADPSSNTFGQ